MKKILLFLLAVIFHHTLFAQEVDAKLLSCNSILFSQEKVNKKNLPILLLEKEAKKGVWYKFQRVNRSKYKSDHGKHLFKNLDEGNYRVTIISNAGERFTSKAITVLCSNEKKTDISSQAVVFPNPASSIVNIQVAEPLQSGLNYQIFTINGKQVQSGKITKTLLEIDVKDFKKGVYFIKISNAQKVNRTHKILIK